MAEGFIRVNPDSTGKAVATNEMNNAAGVTVEKQQFVIADSSVNLATAQVINNPPSGGEYGLVVRTIGSSSVNFTGSLPTGTNTIGNVGIVGPVTLTNTTAVQAVSGSLTILNYPPSQVVSGIVSISNQPSFAFDGSGNLKTTASISSVSISNQPPFVFDGTGHLLTTSVASSGSGIVTSLPPVVAGSGFPTITNAGISGSNLITVQGANNAVPQPISGSITVIGPSNPVLTTAGTPATGTNLITIQGSPLGTPIPISTTGAVNISSAGVSAASAANVQGITGGTPIAVTGSFSATTVFPYSGTTDSQTSVLASTIGNVGYNGTTWDRIKVANAGVQVSGSGVQVIQGIGISGAVPVTGNFSASATVTFPYTALSDSQPLQSASLVGLAVYNGTTIDRLRSIIPISDAQAPVSTLATTNFNYGWNGTNWDRISSQTINGTNGYMRNASVIRDPFLPNNIVSVAAFHNNDNSNLGTTGYGLLTGGVAQLLNVNGALDRQRETGLDSVPAVGISSGSTQLAQQFTVICSTTINPSTSSQIIAVNAINGVISGVPWSIQVGSVLTCDTGNSLESVIVLSVSGLTITAIFTKAHISTWNITSFVYNQARDASGELDGATGSGTAIAVAYNYNNGGPGYSNYDRARNLQGKGIASISITTATVGSTSLILSAIPVGLQSGQSLFLSQSATNLLTGTTEVVYVASNYITGSTTIPLRSPIITSGHTIALYDVFNALGPTTSKILPSGISVEAGVVYDPTSGLYGEEFAYTQDAMTLANIEVAGLMGYNGTTADRLRSDIGVLRITSGGSGTTSISSGTASNTTIKSSPGRLCRVLVTQDGATGAPMFYDTNSTITNQTVVGIIPAGSPIGYIGVFDFYCSNGITLAGNANNPSMTISYY